MVRFPIVIFALIIGLSAVARADDAQEFAERHARLKKGDADSRLDLADWCQRRGLLHQQAEVLIEAVKLRPEDEKAYARLLEVDARRVRPIDAEWAGKIEKLLGASFRLLHSEKFTLLTDVDDATARAQLVLMERAYRAFYDEAPRIGLRPLPPPGRLVCVFFERHGEFKDFQKRFEGGDVAWNAGHYSWRTNRTSFFHDKDSPVFAEVRENISRMETRIGFLKEELAKLPQNATARRLEAQRELRQLDRASAELTMRLKFAGTLGTASKTYHEVTHQLAFNSGLQQRGRAYPFWLSEGLACLFEITDPDGSAGPRRVHQYKLAAWRKLQEEGKLTPLRDLLAHRPGDDDDAEAVAGYYAQVWALMHYLWNQRPRQLAAMMGAIDATPRIDDWQALFSKHLDDEEATVERAWRKYMDELK